MKKILPFLLIFALLFAQPVFSKPYGMIRLAVEKNDAERGEEFAVSVEMPRNPGVKLLRLKVSYSAEQLELKLAEDEKLLSGGLFAQSYGENASSYVLYWSQPHETDSVGRLAKLFFRVKDTAPVGLCSISASLDEWDSLDEAGERVGFDLPTLYLNIPCHHEFAVRTTEKPVSLAENGLDKILCSVCGEEWEEEVFPTLVSRDGKATATVTAGEFTEEIAPPALTFQTFLAGADFAAAKDAFGDRLVRVFRLKFSREGSAYVPQQPTRIALSSQESGMELYRQTETGFEKTEAEEENGVYRFDYADALFVLVQPEKEPLPPEPPVTVPEPTEPPPSSSTLLPGEEGFSTRDILFLAGGGALIVVLAVFIVILLRARRRDI